MQEGESRDQDPHTHPLPSGPAASGRHCPPRMSGVTELLEWSWHR